MPIISNWPQSPGTAAPYKNHARKSHVFAGFRQDQSDSNHRNLKDSLKLGVIEADIESTVDAEKVAARGIPAVQLRTGGFCHLDATMVTQGIDALAVKDLDLVIIENVGNLVCPAEFDTGAHKNVMILSVPEGDDKPLKYPLMFSICDLLL